MKYDAVVVGAGPAGSICAQRLSNAGYKTLVIDSFEQQKVCAGILTAQYVRKYGIIDDFVEIALKGIRISSGAIKAEISYRKEFEYSINRETFDRFNLDEALTSGCLLRKDKVCTIEEEKSGAIIKTNKNSILADYVVIASGISGLSQMFEGPKRYAFCVQQKKYIQADDFYEIDLKPGSYSWIAPKKDHILAGCSSFKSYPDIQGERGRIPLGPVKKTFSKRFLLAGDAAGFVSPFEGEGLYYARRSGEIAAEILSDAISGESCLGEYQVRWKKEFNFSSLSLISHMISSKFIQEAFVRSIRNTEHFHDLMHHILTGNDKKLKPREIIFFFKTLTKNLF